jgi:hypothetical protein
VLDDGKLVEALDCPDFTWVHRLSCSRKSCRPAELDCGPLVTCDGLVSLTNLLRCLLGFRQASLLGTLFHH